MTLTSSNHAANYLALDVGTARVGVAIASAEARLPQPHATLAVSESLWEELQALCHREHVGIIVVGLPRGLDGQETAQTAYARQFADQLVERLGGGLQVVLQDEALTSQQAIAELGSTKKQYKRADVDALAAVYILEDYLREHTRGAHE